MPIIAFTNQKGGVGKTTTAVNVAAALAKAGRPTLLVDNDPQGNATSGLGLEKNEGSGTYELMINGASLPDVVQKTKLPNLEAITANRHLAGAEVELTQAEGRYVRLARGLAAHHYDYVIIDCPPSLNFLSLNALVAAKYVVIPVQAEYYALEGLSSLFDILRKVRKSLNPELTLLGVAITMYDKRLRLSAQVHTEVKRHFSDHLFETVIPRSVRLAEAPSFGEPIGFFDRFSKGATAYHSLAEEVHVACQTRAWQRT